MQITFMLIHCDNIYPTKTLSYTKQLEVKQLRQTDKQIIRRKRFSLLCPVSQTKMLQARAKKLIMLF